MAFNGMFLVLKGRHCALYEDIQGIVGTSPFTPNIVTRWKLVINRAGVCVRFKAHNKI
jgi:hypothetical protein